MLDGLWLFEEHIRELQSKASRGLATVRRAANTVSDMESRIPAIPTHSLPGSLVNYSMAVVGTRCSQICSGRVGSQILARATEKIVGAGPTIRREILRLLADARSFGNHSALNAATMVDRVLRADGASARLDKGRFVQKIALGQNISCQVSNDPK